MREEARAKRQLCEEAVIHQEQADIFEFECNTKGTQTEMTLEDLYFQSKTLKKVDFGVQYFIEDSDEQQHATLNDTETESENCDESDESEKSFDESDISINENEGHPINTIKPPKAAFIVYWTSLLILLKRCLHSTCLLPATISDILMKGSQMIVKMKCEDNHKNVWQSQPNCNRYSVGNLTGAASVQNRYLHGIVNRTFMLKSKAIIEEIKEGGNIIDLSGDRRCDSPGHNAKYLTYSFIDKSTNKIVAFSLTQVTEAGNSNRMEKMGFKKALASLKNQGINPEQITTDRHTQIRKYMREEPTINHQFDVWHFVKNIKKKLLAASKKSSCKIIEKWIKSIGNHFWWSCATCNGDAELLREKWISELFHIQNKHTWTGNKKFRKCEHSRLTKKQIKAKEWLSPKSDAFEALQNIVLEKKTLDNLPYLAKFRHTGVLEVYHSLYNKWAPKRQHFSYAGMLTRCQFAIMDFNQGSNLEQATTEKGEKRYNVQFSKVTKNWSSKPVKKEKIEAIYTR